MKLSDDIGYFMNQDDPQSKLIAGVMLKELIGIGNTLYLLDPNPETLKSISNLEKLIYEL